MLAGLTVPDDAVAELTQLIRAAAADDLADRLDLALAYGATLLALSLDERAVLLAVLEDPPHRLAELRAVLLNDDQWRRSEGLV